MELKTYQKQVMDDLSSYLGHLNRDGDMFAAWKGYWMDKDVAVGLGGVPAYKSAIPGVPHICTKVPTGGGKTFMACTALKRIFDTMPMDKPQVVVWLVPSDSILTQTTRNLSNPDHEYRLRLNLDFAGRVGVYTKEMLLSGQQFSPDTVREMLTVCVLSYASLRIDSKKKDVRKVYQENGNLLKFAQYFKDDSVLLADTPDTALIQLVGTLCLTGTSVRAVSSGPIGRESVSGGTAVGHPPTPPHEPDIPGDSAAFQPSRASCGQQADAAD